MQAVYLRPSGEVGIVDDRRLDASTGRRKRKLTVTGSRAQTDVSTPIWPAAGRAGSSDRGRRAGSVSPTRISTGSDPAHSRLRRVPADRLLVANRVGWQLRTYLLRRARTRGGQRAVRRVHGAQVPPARHVR